MLLRQDNARFRLLAKSKDIAIHTSSYLSEVQHDTDTIAKELDRLKSTHSGQHSLVQILSRPGGRYADLPNKRSDLSVVVIEQVEIEVKYEGYIAQEKRHAEKARHLDEVRMPSWLRYDEIPTLRKEAREKLARIRPDNLGQAARVPGISPADISVLRVLIKRGPAAKESRQASCAVCPTRRNSS